MIEDPKNPPKDSMSRVGAVTIVIEPHIIEATMYTVKGPKPKPLPQQELLQQQQQQQQQMYAHPQHQQQQPIQYQQQQRPIIQYGPPNGAMPQQGVQSPASTGPASAHSTPAPQAGHTASPVPAAGPATSTTAAAPPAAQQKVEAVPTPPASAPQQTTAAATKAPPAPNVKTEPAAPNTVPVTPPAKPANTPAPRAPAGTTAPAGAAPTAAKPATNGPVIAMLAAKASGDTELRDLMKRVAVGKAKHAELAHFQKIINQLTEEHEKKMAAQLPTADQLYVNGRTVQYYSSEVKTILEVVLRSNPTQKSADLRPPEGSDPFVVLVVKTALEDHRTRDMIRRIAEGKTNPTDARDLKEILDRLYRDAQTLPQSVYGYPGQRPPMQNGMRPGHQMQHMNQQPIRAKPPPPNRPEIASVVFDFGTGDRYMFPKYSILEFLPTTAGQQVIASFLIVRKGSVSEYGGDPSLDYYQPVTIRLQTSSGRHLENLARVVAPQDEVRRYMDDVMDNMTRAEYVLLAMRLPRELKDGDEEEDTPDETATEAKADSTRAAILESDEPSVLWTVDASASLSDTQVPRSLQPLDLEEEAQEKYQRLVRSTAERNVELV